MYRGSILQAEVQPAAQIPAPALSTGGPGAETHLPAPGGESCHPHAVMAIDHSLCFYTLCCSRRCATL